MRPRIVLTGSYWSLLRWPLLVHMHLSDLVARAIGNQDPAGTQRQTGRLVEASSPAVIVIASGASGATAGESNGHAVRRYLQEAGWANRRGRGASSAANPRPCILGRRCLRLPDRTSTPPSVT